MTVWLVLLLAGGGSLLGGEPVPEADSIVLGLTPVLSVSDRTDAAGEEDGFYVYSELGFRLVWGGIAVYLDFGVDKLRPYLMDDQGNRLVFDSLLEALKGSVKEVLCAGSVNGAQVGSLIVNAIEDGRRIGCNL